MRIAICIKQVLDPATIKVSRSRQAIDDRQAKKILNPPDRWALDTALQFKEKDPSTELCVLRCADYRAFLIRYAWRYVGSPYQSDRWLTDFESDCLYSTPASASASTGCPIDNQ